MILIDLNVLLDVIQKREPHYHASSALIEHALNNASQRAFIPAHAVTTIHYLVARYGTRQKANRAVDWLLRHFEVAAATSQELQRARALDWADFEDAVVAAAAESCQCRAIITRNVKDFGHSTVPASTPEEYLLLHRR